MGMFHGVVAVVTGKTLVGGMLAADYFAGKTG